MSAEEDRIASTATRLSPNWWTASPLYKSKGLIDAGFLEQVSESDVPPIAGVADYALEGGAADDVEPPDDSEPPDAAERLDAEVREALIRKLGRRRGNWAADRVSFAADAFAEDRHPEALELLKPAMDAGAGDVVEVRELFGLVHYRLGHWSTAARALEIFRNQTRSLEQHPVLADCYRALRRWSRVEELWRELSVAAVSSALRTEGVIVAAGALSDQGRDAEALALLTDGWRLPKRPKDHHLRQAYALADCYDRGGDQAAARRLFRWVVNHDPEFADAARRAEAVGA